MRSVWLIPTRLWRPSTIIVAALACRGANHVDRSPSPAAETTADSVPVAVSIYQSLYSIGTTRREVRAELGTPITARADTVSNRHVEAIDSVFVWTYEGLEFQFYWATPVERELLLKTTANANHRRVAGLSEIVGTPEAAGLRLGEVRFRDMVADTTRLYFPISEEMGAEDTLILSYVGGRLVRIAIAPYVD